MHWVDRGPEPAGLAAVRARYAPRWVDYFQGKGSKPGDSRWRDFRDDLCGAFSGLCAYCEEGARGEVDHFRPKSKFPEWVYEWSNWVFACHDCNRLKGDKWPPNGYVDPCSTQERPENFFRFDTTTGEILPKPELGPDLRDKAQQTIDDLSLNASHHLKKRLWWVAVVSRAISRDPERETGHDERFRTFLASRTTGLSSITRAWLVEQGY